MLLSGSDHEGAYLLGEKIRTSIAETSFILDDTMRLTRMTVSVGVNQFDGNRKRFFQGADEALYRAKALGKDTVVVARREDLDDEDESDAPTPDENEAAGETARDADDPAPDPADEETDRDAGDAI